jgi:glycosyltransferase involved in cell wall biosynthesis
MADKIIVIDKGSTDGTQAIVKYYGGEVVDFPCKNGEMDDVTNQMLKNTFYQRYTGEYDWFIIVDNDELLYYDGDFKELLKGYDAQNITFPYIQGYNMVGDDVPEDDGLSLLTDHIKTGILNNDYSKRVLFHKSVEPGYNAGAHQCSPRGIVVETTFPGMLLHYRHLSPSWSYHRARRTKLSEHNRQHGLGLQGADISMAIPYHNDLWNKREQVLP